MIKFTNSFILALGTARAAYKTDNSLNGNDEYDPCAFAFQFGPVTSPEHMRFLIDSPQWPACQAKIDAENEASTQKFLRELSFKKESCEMEGYQSEECEQIQESLSSQVST